jgi:hypothetical protein
LGARRHVYFGVPEEKLLQEACELRDVPHKMVKLLLGVAQSYDGMYRRRNVYAEYDAILRRDWRSDEEILASIAQPQTDAHHEGHEEEDHE